MIVVEQIVSRMPVSVREIISMHGAMDTMSVDGRSMEQALHSDERLIQIEKQMSVWVKETLRFVLLHFACIPFRLDTLERIALLEGMPGSGVAEGVAMLQRFGILFAFKHRSGEILYVMPAEIAANWSAKWFPTSFLPTYDDVFSKSYPLEHPDLASRLFEFLVLIQQREVCVTKKGALTKRSADLLANTVYIQDEAVSSLSLPVRYFDIQVPSIGFLFTLCFRLGLVDVHDQRICLDSAKVEEWLSLDDTDMNRRLYLEWKKLHVPTSPAAMRMWFSLETVDAGHTYILESCSVEFQRQVLRPLAALGWLDLQKGSDASRYLKQLERLDDPQTPEKPSIDGPSEFNCFIRWRFPLNSCVDMQRVTRVAFYVQPDFELIVPPGVPYRILWKIESFSNRKTTIPLRVYEITKESILRALSRGMSIADIRLVLNENSKHGVPDPVSKTIEHWGRNLLNETTMSPISLKKEPYEPKNVTFHDLVLSESTENFILPLVDPIHQSHFEMIAPPQPSVDGTAQFPARWMKELRLYHESTKKQIAETAIANQLMLRLAHAEGETLLTPCSIRHTQSGWILMGYNRTGTVSIHHDQWERMQLIVPSELHSYYF